jgi:hypothetical protein
MYAFRPDSGGVSCLSLSTTVDGESGRRGKAICWKEGVDGIKTRLKIMKRARLEKVSLFKLCRFFKVRWEHFAEWADAVFPDDPTDERVYRIFTKHVWEDEITGEGEQFDKLRREIGLTDAERDV